VKAYPIKELLPLSIPIIISTYRFMIRFAATDKPQKIFRHFQAHSPIQIEEIQIKFSGKDKIEQKNPFFKQI